MKEAPHTHRAAATIGRLAAQGLLRVEEAMPHVVAAACQPGVDAPGARMRLMHTCLDTSAHWGRLRARAGWHVAQALAPLLAARCCRAEILAAAWHAGARFGLLRHETDTQAAAAVGRALHQETRR